MGHCPANTKRNAIHENKGKQEASSKLILGTLRFAFAVFQNNIYLYSQFNMKPSARCVVEFPARYRRFLP